MDTIYVYDCLCIYIKMYMYMYMQIYLQIYFIPYISLYRHVQIGGFSLIFWNVHLRTLGGRRCTHFDEHVFPMIPMGGEDPPF